MNTTSLMSELWKSPPYDIYSIILALEGNFDRNIGHEWMRQHWHQAFYYILLYLFVIFRVQAYMKSRRRFELRPTLVTWNVFLAAFSIIGFYRTIPEMVHVLKEFGFTHSVCFDIFVEEYMEQSFWIWIFGLSKVLELVDTVFIVLRKQQLIFLHWYHHSTVLLFAWYGYTELLGPRRWFITMNYFVHSLMYSYYAMRAMHFKMPRAVSILITSLQILQMVTGLVVTVFAYLTRQNGQVCQIPDNIANFAFVIYFSYMVLFGRFFYNAYITPSSKSKKTN